MHEPYYSYVVNNSEIYMCMKIHRGWDAAAIKYSELGKGGVMKSGVHIKGN